MGKYNYSLERVNVRGERETLSVQGCDSFDEAIKIVEKGKYDRELSEAPLRSASKKPEQPKAVTAPKVAVPDMVQPLDGDGRPLGDPVNPNKDDNNKQQGE